MGPFPVLLANRARLTQETVHQSVHSWLSSRGGFPNVRFTPSKIRREQVRADVDPAAALGMDYDGTTARLEVQFESPRDAPRNYHRIRWAEPNRSSSVGWHQDEHRDELGECHLQLDNGDEVVDVQTADFLDAHPLNVVETRLEQLPGVLERISRDGEELEFEA